MATVKAVRQHLQECLDINADLQRDHDEDYPVTRSFADAGVSSKHDGVVISMPDGSKFKVYIVKQA